MIRRILRSLWFILSGILGVAFYLLLLLGPLYLFGGMLVTFVGCDPLLAILLCMGVGVPWAMLLPHLFE